MKLTTLGSGTWVMTSGQNSSSHLVETDENKLLFDIGRGTARQLFEYGLGFQDIDTLFISHFHQDHVSEIVPFVFFCMTKYAEYYCSNKNLKIYGPKGLKKFIKRIYKTFNIKYDKKFLPELIEVKDGSLIRGSDYVVEVFKVIHSTIDSFAYRISSNGKSMVYSGDTTLCSGIRSATKNVDLALIESTSDSLEEVHITGVQVGLLAKESGVKHLVITHVAPSYKHSKLRRDIRKNYDGRLSIASDGKSYNI
jgi:ribonuclease BN (tRNA processing enzyme)